MLKFGAWLFALSVCSACSDTMTGSVTQTNEPQSVAQITAFLNEARKLALADVNNDAVYQLPDSTTDFVQRQTPFELWTFMAIVADDAGNRYALQQRFVRLKIKPMAQPVGSAWDFSDVLALDFSFQIIEKNAGKSADRINNTLNEKFNGKIDSAQSLVQREALNLAGASTQANTVWVDAFTASLTHKNDQASVPCSQSIAISAPYLTLKFEQTHCGQVERSASFAFSQSAAMPVNGRYSTDGFDLDLVGHGWFMHGWGLPLDSAATAVVFDRAWFWLDDEIDIQLTRTRRRSGRGPTKTSGTLTRTGDTTVTQLASAQWDDDARTSKHNAPLEWQFQEKAQQMELQLHAVGRNVQPFPVGQTDWFGAVKAEGSHTGYGFLHNNAR